jgi:hypothetical protein
MCAEERIASGLELPLLAPRRTSDSCATQVKLPANTPTALENAKTSVKIQPEDLWGDVPSIIVTPRKTRH